MVEQKNKKISKKDEKILKEKTKKLSIKDGVGYSVMTGAGVNYITPYALSVGANNTQIGFLSSFPSLFGSLFQLFTTNAIKKTSRKKVILAGVLLQALMWIPVLIAGYLFFYKNVNSGISTTLIIIFFTLLTIFGSFTSPAWNSMMRDIVGKETGKYFGNRNKIIGIITITVMIACGILLSYLNRMKLLFLGFAIIFGVALLARTFSWIVLKKHYDPEFKFKQKNYFGFRQFIKKLPKSNFAKFSVFVALIMFATYIASPFFSVYLLKNLHLDYIAWVLITISNPLSTMLFMPFWGKFADRFGNLKVLKWTGALVFLVPIFYFFTMFMLNSIFLIAYLFATEFFSGFIWAGFNLTSINFIYDAVSRQKLSLCISYFNMLSGAGVFIGAVIGGVISSANFNFFGINAILFVFLLSAAARIFFYLIMVSKIKEVRNVENYKLREELRARFVSIYSRFGIKVSD